MSQIAIPPRDSLKGSDERISRRKEAKRARKEAGKYIESFDGRKCAEYWTFCKQKTEASLLINEIDHELAKEGLNNDSDKYLRRKDELEEEVDAAERKIRRYEAQGRIIDIDTNTKMAEPVCLRASYMDLILSVKSKTTSSNGQRAFTYNLKENYGSKKMASCMYVWSPMLGKWAAKCEINATHIFPLSLGQETMTFIFGEDAKRDINKAANGLFLHGSVGEFFKKHRIVIVPCDDHNDHQDEGKQEQDQEHQHQHQQNKEQEEAKAPKPQEWKFLVPEREKLRIHPFSMLGKDGTIADLHERKLIFEPGNPFRPKAQYLYFHYLVAMLQLRHGREKEEDEAEEEAEAEAEEVGKTETSPKIKELSELTKMWANNTREKQHLRENIPQAFIEGLGLGGPGDPALKDQLDEMTQLIANAKTIEVESEEENSSDDDDNYWFKERRY